MNIKYIYHLADLHIRNVQRHNEYRQVFQKFIDKVISDDIKESIIYIGGDIAHAKTDMSPELVDQISWFLTECAKLRETIVITGNHDCNLNNHHRLDALTPIIDNLNNPKIHYLRDTGIYEIHNLTFCVYSILDNKDNWPSGHTVKGDTTICLFHGPVRSSMTDMGFKISSHSFEPELFDGFDMVLMGDIHKRQIVQKYDKSNKKPIMVYPGSMIQQNHGELLNDHGHLLWDVENRTFTSHDIKNDYGFLTIDIKKAKIPKWVYNEKDTILPKHPKIRLRFSSTDTADVKKCITELKTMFKSCEITVSRMDTIGSLKLDRKLNQNIVGNVKDETFQNNLIRDYLERRFLLPDEDLDEIEKINTEVNTKIDDTDVASNILWTPIELQFSNMFSYGEDNKVRFDRAKGIVGIFAPNASGKSSIFDSLCFCLYDKTNRTSFARNIINNQKDTFECKFQFEIDGVNYFIHRKAKWVRNGAAVKVDVDFWKEDGGVVENLNGEHRRDTNRNIEKYIGTFDDFILTTLSVQGNNALFIDKSQSERKDTLSQFMGLDIFDKLYQVAYDENRDNSTIIKKFKSNDFTDKLAVIEQDLINDEKKYKEFNEKLILLKNVRNEFNEKLIDLNSKLVDLKSGNVGIDELKKRKSVVETKLTDLDLSEKHLHDRLAKLENLHLTVSDMLDEIDESKLNHKLKKLNGYITEQSELKYSKDNLNVKIESLTERKNHLDEHEYNPNCEVCVKNSKSILKSKEEVSFELDKLVPELNKVNGRIVELDGIISELLDAESEMASLENIKEKEIKLDWEISNIVSKLTELEAERQKFKPQLEQQNKLISEYYSNEEIIKNNNKLKEEIDRIKDKSKKSNDLIDSIEHNILSLNGRISSNKNQKKTFEDQMNEIKSLEKSEKLYKFYLSALSRNGIQYELIEKVLPLLEGEVNNILSQIVEFGMQLEMDGKNINAYIVYGDEKWSLEMCSGMERFISGLAIRIALINICNLPRTNFLIIDEGFAAMDAENLSNFEILFTYLRTQFEFVMMVSHLDSMRDVVDDLIEIKKYEKFSSVKF